MQTTGASSPTYHVTKADSGERIRCGVVITYNDGRSTSKASASRAITKTRPASVGRPSTLAPEAGDRAQGDRRSECARGTYWSVCRCYRGPCWHGP
jgi:hypothetical protein